MNGSAIAGWFWSLLLHSAIVAFVAVLMAGLLMGKVPLAHENADIVPIDIVDFSDFSNVSAIAKTPLNTAMIQPEAQGSPQPSAPEEETEAIPDPNAKPQKKEDKPKSPNFADLQKLIDRSKKTAGASEQETSNRGVKGDKDRACVGACDKLSANERDYIRSKLETCWRSNADQAHPERTRVTVKFLLNRDGSLRGEPKITAPAFIPPTDTALRVAARNAVNAVRDCAPFNGLRAERYANWREISSTFGVNGVE
jgi:hypothetical protein